jgi:DNA-binding MarR family transcriptional regulator
MITEDGTNGSDAGGVRGPVAESGTLGLATVDALAQLSFTVHGLLERRAAEHDVSITAGRLLGILRDRTPTINELAALLELDKSSVSGLIDRAARRGLVQRMPSADDRRSVRVGLTDAGRAVAARVAADFGRDVTSLLAVLDADDRARLTRLAEAILAAHLNDLGVTRT